MNYSRSSHPQPVTILKDIVIPSNARNLLSAAATAPLPAARSLASAKENRVRFGVI